VKSSAAIFHQLIGAIFTLFSREILTDLQHGHQVVEHAQATENGRFLRQIANAATGAGMQRQQAEKRLFFRLYVPRFPQPQ
jgi:hypothetical protein